MDIREITKKAVKVLKKHGVEAIYIFGSAVDGTFGEASDIDLAVTKLPPQEYFSAMASLVDELKRPVDLIRLETVSPLMREHIQSIGEKIAA